MYNIIDLKTKSVVATSKTLLGAARKVDKLDLAYGACRYTYKKLEA